jgi:uncharacterized coiled-coil DUF342 family protein
MLTSVSEPYVLQLQGMCNNLQSNLEQNKENQAITQEADDLLDEIIKHVALAIQPSSTDTLVGNVWLVFTTSQIDGYSYNCLDYVSNWSTTNDQILSTGFKLLCRLKSNPEFYKYRGEAQILQYKKRIQELEELVVDASSSYETLSETEKKVAGLNQSATTAHSTIIAFKDEVEELQAEELLENVQAIHDKAKSLEANISTLNQSAIDSDTVITTFREKIEELQADELLENVQTIHDNAKSLEANISTLNQSATSAYNTITTFKDEVEELQADELLENVQAIHDNIVELEGEAKTLLQTNETTFKNNLDTLTKALADYEKLEAKTQDLQRQTEIELANALGIGTFKEFDAVRQLKDKTSEKWFRRAFQSTIISFGIILVLIILGSSHFGIKANVPYFEFAIPVFQSWLEIASFIVPKISLTLILSGLTIFFFERFLKESRLAEEYRFKSTCALHFDSYMRLVKELCETEADKEYRDFLTHQIQELFSSPTERIYKDSNTINMKALKTAREALEIAFPQMERVTRLLTLAENIVHDTPVEKESQSNAPKA